MKTQSVRGTDGRVEFRKVRFDEISTENRFIFVDLQRGVHTSTGLEVLTNVYKLCMVKERNGTCPESLCRDTLSIFWVLCWHSKTESAEDSVKSILICGLTTELH